MLRTNINNAVKIAMSPQSPYLENINAIAPFLKCNLLLSYVGYPHLESILNRSVIAFLKRIFYLTSRCSAQKMSNTEMALVISQSLFCDNATILAAFLKRTLSCSKINIVTKDGLRQK